MKNGQDQPRVKAKMSKEPLMAGECWEACLLVREHYDSLKQNFKRRRVDCISTPLMEVLHFFKFILVLVHPHAYYSVYKIVYSAFTLLFYTDISTLLYRFHTH